MKCYQLMLQLGCLGVFCVLITVRESNSTFVPGRCLCPIMETGVRGDLKDLTVIPISPSCNRVTVIVTLKRKSTKVCLNPEGPRAKRLIRCWNRTKKLNRDTKVCLKRQRRRQRGRQQHRRA